MALDAILWYRIRYHLADVSPLPFGGQFAEDVGEGGEVVAETGEIVFRDQEDVDGGLGADGGVAGLVVHDSHFAEIFAGGEGGDAAAVA